MKFNYSRHKETVKQLIRHSLARVGLILLLIFFVTALFAPYLAPEEPSEQDLVNSLESPNADAWFGTDSFGRDVFSRVIHGSRISVYVGLSIVTYSLILGVPIGLIAGYYSSTRIDNILMRLMDTILAFPSIILALMIMGVLGPSLHNVIMALTIVNIPVFARIVRGNTLSVMEEEYTTSAKAVGSSDFKIIRRHVFPNVIPPIIVQGTLVFAFAILNEATLSFLGIGTQPPTPSWGLMLNEGRSFIDENIWMSIFPGIAIMLTVLSLNFVGDALRDVLDPKYNEEEFR